MTDIAQRMREGIDPADIPEAEAAMDKAADEIERLRVGFNDIMALLVDPYVSDADARIDNAIMTIRLLQRREGE